MNAFAEGLIHYEPADAEFEDIETDVDPVVLQIDIERGRILTNPSRYDSDHEFPWHEILRLYASGASENELGRAAKILCSGCINAIAYHEICDGLLPIKQDCFDETIKRVREVVK